MRNRNTIAKLAATRGMPDMGENRYRILITSVLGLNRSQWFKMLY